jgi:hypothetical protein
MTRIRMATARATRALSASLCLALPLLAPARDIHAGVSPSGAPYLTGGADAAQRELLEGLRSRYSLWLVTRDRVGGAALTGVHLRIIDARRQLVFDHRLRNPWLLIDLPAGRFEVESSYHGRLRRWTVESYPGDPWPCPLYERVLARAGDVEAGRPRRG